MQSEKGFPEPSAYRWDDASPIAGDVQADVTSQQPMHFPEPHIDMPFPSTSVILPLPAGQKPANGLPSNTSTALLSGPNTQAVGSYEALGPASHSSNSSGTSHT